MENLTIVVAVSAVLITIFLFMICLIMGRLKEAVDAETDELRSIRYAFEATVRLMDKEKLEDTGDNKKEGPE